MPLRSATLVSPRPSAATSKAGATDDALRLPSLKVLNLDADFLREKNSIHSGYMTRTLELLTPMLRVLHVFRAMNQVPELAAFYNANRLVRGCRHVCG